MSTRKGTTAEDVSETVEPSGVVDIITTQPGYKEMFDMDLSGLPEQYRDESYLIMLASATSLADIDENFLAELTQVYGSGLIAKEHLVDQPFVILGYRRTVGNYTHEASGEFLKYYTLTVLCKEGRGNVVLSGTGMDPVFSTLEASGKNPPYLVPKGLRRSDDWQDDKGRRMNGTWYLG